VFSQLDKKLVLWHSSAGNKRVSIMSENLSITGKRWQLRSQDERAALALSRQLGVSDVLGRVLAGRGIDQGELALSFLSPKLAQLPDPAHLLDMGVAVERLLQAIENNEKIAIFGDYDVDGACATAVLVRFFRSIGLEALLYIPDRMVEGYGPNADAMDSLKEMGADVVITVDCGSVAFEPIAHAAEIGLDVIVTDHHQTKPEKPACLALINPNRVDETSECTMLSGAGVAFYLVLALTRALRAKKFFTEELKEPDNRSLLDLVAVATICDMVPLTGPNRVLVQQGLRGLAMRQNFGLAALVDVAEVEEKPTAYHVGFVIGPRINAGGRVAECDLGAKLLSTENPAEAREIAERLQLLNEERKEIEAAVLDEALIQAEKVFTEDTSALVLAGEGWHAGVIGIVASRVKERYHRPTIIIAIDGEDCKGSGRSVAGVDLGKAIVECSDLLTKGGGHKMAAGLSMQKENIAAFTEKLNSIVKKQAEVSENDIFQPRLSVDGFVMPAALNSEFMQELDKLEPYGSGHAEPRFVLNAVHLNFARAVGAEQNHVQIAIETVGGKTLKGIVFRAMESDLGPYLIKSAQSKERVSLCGVARRNYWQGREQIQLQVQDAFPGRWTE